MENLSDLFYRNQESDSLSSAHFRTIQPPINAPAGSSKLVDR